MAAGQVGRPARKREQAVEAVGGRHVKLDAAPARAQSSG